MTLPGIRSPAAGLSEQISTGDFVSEPLHKLNETHIHDRYYGKDPTQYTHFEIKYPPDRYGDETADQARVWKIYRDRADEVDTDMTDSWNDTLNILLIFAGLFSAVQVSSADFQEYTAAAIFNFMSSVNNGSTGSLQLTPPGVQFVSTSVRWINGLWVTSLVLCLLVALLAILAKQWINEYRSRMRAHVASPRRWAQRHAAYSRGLQQWGVGAFISSLPLILHLALFLFLAGLMVFFLDLDSGIAFVILAVSSPATAFYVLATVAPLWHGECPSSTPLIYVMHRYYHRLRVSITTFWSRLGLVLLLRRRRPPVRSSIAHPISPLPAFHEDRLLLAKEPTLIPHVLHWMVTSLPVAEEVAVALDAIGSQDIEHHRAYFKGGKPAHSSLVSSSITQRADARLQDICNAFTNGHPTAHPTLIGRVLRTSLICQTQNSKPEFLYRIPFSTYAFLSQCTRYKTHDIAVLSQVLAVVLGGHDALDEALTDLERFWIIGSHQTPPLLDSSLQLIAKTVEEFQKSPRWSRLRMAGAAALLRDPKSLVAATLVEMMNNCAHLSTGIGGMTTDSPWLRYLHTLSVATLSISEESAVLHHLSHQRLQSRRDIELLRPRGSILPAASNMLPASLRYTDFDGPNLWSERLGNITFGLLHNSEDYHLNLLKFADLLATGCISEGQCRQLMGEFDRPEEAVSDTLLNILTPREQSDGTQSSIWQILSETLNTPEDELSAYTLMNESQAPLSSTIQIAATMADMLVHLHRSDSALAQALLLLQGGIRSAVILAAD
ncbi:hypothetical protein BKA62DRAFT_729470 [Auriculariales sp. MPI-PUGE-AT-0066]|nr:hypothetical protein BKA62DRAFT_729470 [Auriculariales sp. MPI-PUGE-AT-0066]